METPPPRTRSPLTDSATIVWFVLLSVVGFCGLHFHHSRLTLVLVGILAVYGLMLSTSRGLIGRSHSFGRPLPWSVLALGFVIACTGTSWWLPEPRFDTGASLEELPVSLNTVALGMTPKEVLKSIGVPDSKQRYHFGRLEMLSGLGARYVINATADSGMGAVLQDGPGIVAAIDEVLRVHPPKGDYGGAQARLSVVFAEMKKGKSCRVVMVDQEIKSGNVQQVLGSLDADVFNYDFLFVVTKSKDSPFRGLMLQQPALAEGWWYKDSDLIVVFSDSDGFFGSPKVSLVSGTSLRLRGKVWSKRGDLIRTLNKPGAPLNREPNIDPDNRHEFRYQKIWGDNKIIISSGIDDKITSIEVEKK